MPLISVDSLVENLGDADWRVVDCRFELGAPEAGRRAWVRGHVPGAVYADLEEDLSGAVGPGTGRHPLPASDDFVVRCRAWGISDATHVVAYDAVGGALAASRLWWMLRDHGHERAYVLDGGWTAWVAADAPVERGALGVAPGAFTGTAGRLRAATAHEAFVAPVLLDARDPQRYRGDVETIDRVAGHIPGALNLPHRALVGGDGRFLERAVLRARLTEALAGREPAEVVAYCWSGVTACQLVVAFEEAGLPGVRLYCGSWSEWIRDPTRPVARGG